jgi:hypothetical protein
VKVYILYYDGYITNNTEQRVKAILKEKLETDKIILLPKGWSLEELGQANLNKLELIHKDLSEILNIHEEEKKKVLSPMTSQDMNVIISEKTDEKVNE